MSLLQTVTAGFFLNCFPGGPMGDFRASSQETSLPMIINPRCPNFQDYASLLTHASIFKVTHPTIKHLLLFLGKGQRV